MKIIDKKHSIGKWGHDCKYEFYIKIFFAKISLFLIPELIVYI